MQSDFEEKSYTSIEFLLRGVPYWLVDKATEFQNGNTKTSRAALCEYCGENCVLLCTINDSPVFGGHIILGRLEE